jgi:hypothetical protein
MEKICNMKQLESKLAYYKMIVNSSYGSQSITDVYYEVSKLKSKIRTVKKRKEKIKKIFDGR